MNSNAALVLAFMLALGACAPSAPAARPASDPASPLAKEGATETANAPAPVDVAANDVVYACPMHPEVTAKEPSLCPKCNMKLVPKK